MIVADPPWKYLWGDGGMKCPERHYNTLTPDELCALPVKRLRAQNCALALWATGPCLPDAMRIMESWGFKYKTILFVWVKQNRIAKTIVTGCGSYTRSACELVLLGMRGHVKRETNEAISQVILSPRGGHSQKPEIMQDLLMRIFPGGPYLELFARRKRHGWDVFGNQVECDLFSDAQPTGHNSQMNHQVDTADKGEGK